MARKQKAEVLLIYFLRLSIYFLINRRNGRSTRTRVMIKSRFDAGNTSENTDACVSLEKRRIQAVSESGLILELPLPFMREMESNVAVGH